MKMEEPVPQAVIKSKNIRESRKGIRELLMFQNNLVLKDRRYAGLFLLSLLSRFAITRAV